MGHMSDDEEKYTVTVRWPNTEATNEIYHGCTNVDNNGDEVSFDDNNGKHHQFTGVTYHIVEE